MILISVSASQIIGFEQPHLVTGMKEMIFAMKAYSHGYLKKMSAFKLINTCFQWALL